MSPTRRLAAILAADVAGFSAAMERDEEGTFARVQELRQAVVEPNIAAHQGRLIKTTGDGFLAEFASPIAAVRCALAIQAALSAAPLQLRIGLNLGDVIVEDSGDVYGEGVNIAARLESLADPGGTLISAKVFDEVDGKVDASFVDRGDQQVKNIARPVRAYAARSAATPADDGRGAERSLPDKPSIAVLPFQNMSGDPEQDYFADGMVEDIITALSRFRSLFVIARNSSFTYKGKAVDIKQVGRELGVRYVLEGSVRKAGNRVRITGQLVDAASGSHLWADRFDGELADVFDLQDRVTASVVSVIAPRIEQSEIERTRAKPTDRLDSYDMFLRGVAALNDRTTWVTTVPRDAFRKAFELDPNYAAARAMEGYAISLQQTAGGLPLSAADSDDAIACVEQACRLAGDDPFVLSRAAHTLAYVAGAYDRGEAMIEEAVALNPNDALAWGHRGWISLMCLKPARALESFEHRLRLSPIDPARAAIWNGMGYAYAMLGDYDKGSAIAARALENAVDEIGRAHV